jgi:hypothetical protein
MKDKFNIITNYVNNNTTDELSIIDELSLIDNFFENLMHSNERIIHSDLILQILWFRKEIDSSEIILRHLENYLKEKKISIRNNIKKGTFEIGTGLNSLIKNYIDKINTCSIFVSDNQKIMSNGLSQLYYKIITDPSLLSFLKLEISSLDESNVNSIKKLTYIMKKISEVNSNIKSYEWFLFLIASSIRTIIEENNNKSYPVPENYQQIINFRENLALYQKVETVYSYLGNDIHIILNSIINILFGTFIEIMKTCSILEFYYIINNYKKIFQTIFGHNNILIQNKKIKDTFTNQFFIFIERIEKEKKLELKYLIKCFQIICELLSNYGNSYHIINIKISEIFSNQTSQNYLLNDINININMTKKMNNIHNIIYFCSNIKDKDIFIEKYNRMLIIRLLHKPNLSIERYYYNILKSTFSIKLLYKTNKILMDVENTLQDRELFIKLAYVVKKENKQYQDLVDYKYDNIVNIMNIITSSYNIWDIKQTEGILDDVTVTNFKDDYIILNMMYIYSKFYELRYENKRKLIWYLHFGEILFDFNEIEFKMLPIQFIILEHIYKMKKVSKNDLINLHIFIGYNEHFKKSIISSLLLGGIIILEESYIKINSDISKINSDISKITTNYIELFFISSSYVDIWNVRNEKELILSREDVLSTCINHIVKKEPVNKIELMYKIRKSMDLFDFNIEFLDNVINNMIKKDYIKYNKEKLEKLIW